MNTRFNSVCKLNARSSISGAEHTSKSVFLTTSALNMSGNESTVNLHNRPSRLNRSGEASNSNSQSRPNFPNARQGNTILSGPSVAINVGDDRPLPSPAQITDASRRDLRNQALESVANYSGGMSLVGGIGGMMTGSSRSEQFVLGGVGAIGGAILGSLDAVANLRPKHQSLQLLEKQLQKNLNHTQPNDNMPPREDVPQNIRVAREIILTLLKLDQALKTKAVSNTLRADGIAKVRDAVIDNVASMYNAIPDVKPKSECDEARCPISLSRLKELENEGDELIPQPIQVDGNTVYNFPDYIANIFHQAGHPQDAHTRALLSPQTEIHRLV